MKWHRLRNRFAMSVREFHRRGGEGSRPEPVVNVHECGKGRIARGKSWECYAFEVDHAQPYLESLGFRFETEEGVIAFTGDAEPNQKVVELGRDADMLVVNALGGVKGAAQAAKEAGAKRLTVVHQPYRLDSDEAIKEAKHLFDGSVYGGEDAVDISW